MSNSYIPYSSWDGESFWINSQEAYGRDFPTLNDALVYGAFQVKKDEEAVAEYSKNYMPLSAEKIKEFM
jgi:hypothetical protein